MERYLDIKYLKGLINKYYPTVIDLDWIDKIVKDFRCEQDKLLNSHNRFSYTYGQIAFLMYSLERHIFENVKIDDFKWCSDRFKNYIIKEFSSYISPLAKIDKDVCFVGNNIFIMGKIHIYSNCVIFGNVYIIAENTQDTDNNILFIGKNTIINNNVKIINSNIGEGVILENGAVVRENIDAFSRVNIVNQLQVTERKNAYIPSQELEIYGLVPKYKNKLTIYGEGIYNPNILLRLGDRKYNIIDIDYWDKNKIILRIKCDKSMANKILEEEKTWRQGAFAKLIIMSRGIKTTVNDNRGIIKLLKNI